MTSLLNESRSFLWKDNVYNEQKVTIFSKKERKKEKKRNTFVVFFVGGGKKTK